MLLNFRNIRAAAMIVLALTGLSLSANAQSSLRIAAIVNEEVISEFDLASRIRMTIYSSGLKDTHETRQKLARQTLRRLIDEQLKLQAAKEKNIKVREREIDQQIARIEQANKMKPGDIQRFFKRNNIDPESMLTQIRSQIAWSKLISRTLRRRVNVGEDEIDEQLEELGRLKDVKQKRVFEIFIPLDSDAREAETRLNVERLIDQLNNGARFTQLARNFSQAQSASLGGDRGWILPSELPDTLQDTVSRLGKGQISEPIETLAGFYILQVTDERSLSGDKTDTRLDLGQISFPLPGEDDPDARNAAMARINQLRQTINGCTNVEEAAASLEGANYSSAANVKVGDLNATIQNAVVELGASETSAPVPLGNNVMLFTVCKRVEAKSNLPSRREIRQQLSQNQLDLLARQYLRDLRYSAFIDIRL